MVVWRCRYRCKCCIFVILITRHYRVSDKKRNLKHYDATSAELRLKLIVVCVCARAIVHCVGVRIRMYIGSHGAKFARWEYLKIVEDRANT